MNENSDPVQSNVLQDNTRPMTLDVSQNAVANSDLPAGLSKSARRALLAAGYTRLDQLTHRSEAEIAQIHGIIGRKALWQLRQALAARGQSFRGARVSPVIDPTPKPSTINREPSPPLSDLLDRSLDGIERILSVKMHDERKHSACNAYGDNGCCVSIQRILDRGGHGIRYDLTRIGMVVGVAFGAPCRFVT